MPGEVAWGRGKKSTQPRVQLIFCLSGCVLLLHSSTFQGNLLVAAAPMASRAQCRSGVWRQQKQKRDLAHSRKPDPHSNRCCGCTFHSAGGTGAEGPCGEAALGPAEKRHGTGRGIAELWPPQPAEVSNQPETLRAVRGTGCKPTEELNGKGTAWACNLPRLTAFRLPLLKTQGVHREQPLVCILKVKN